MAPLASAPPTPATLPRPPWLCPSPPRPPRPLGPAHSAVSGGAAPPTPRASGGAAPPAQPAPLSRPRQAASPQFLTGGGCGGGGVASFDILAAEERAGTSEPTAVAAADPRGPFSRSPALPPPRVRRPRGPAASSRVRPPGGCSHVAGAGGGESAHGDHLPGKRAQQGPGPWGVGGGRPGGGVRPGVRGGLRPWKDRGSEFGAGGSGRAPRRLAVVARGRSGRGGDFTREHPPSPHSWRWRRPASYTFRSPMCREGVGEGGVGGGSVPSLGAASSSAAAPRSRRRAGVAAAPELPGTREQRLVPARGDGGERGAGFGARQVSLWGAPRGSRRPLQPSGTLPRAVLRALRPGLLCEVPVKCTQPSGKR